MFLLQTVDSGTQAFCEGSKLSVMVNDALTNEALENVTATILRLDDGEEQVGVSKILDLASKLHQVIAEGAFPDSNGELTVSLLAPGHYEVQVILCIGDMFLSCIIFQVILSLVTCCFLVPSSRCLGLGM